jgi:hypothetical protein
MMRDFGSKPPDPTMPPILLGIRRLFFGCFGCLGVIILLIVAPIIIREVNTWGHTTPHLPDKIEISRQYIAQDSIGGFLEGCVFEAYELKPQTTLAIEQYGLQFFKDMPQPSDAASKFGTWHRTPVPEKPYAFALGALNGCQNDNSVRDTIGYVTVSEPNNYYSLSSNREGIIVVYPKRRLVVFAYFG